jgi:hypothetical protein
MRSVKFAMLAVPGSAATVAFSFLPATFACSYNTILVFFRLACTALYRLAAYVS